MIGALYLGLWSLTLTPSRRSYVGATLRYHIRTKNQVQRPKTKDQDVFQRLFNEQNLAPLLHRINQIDFPGFVQFLSMNHALAYLPLCQ